MPLRTTQGQVGGVPAAPAAGVAAYTEGALSAFLSGAPHLGAAEPRSPAPLGRAGAAAEGDDDKEEEDYKDAEEEEDEDERLLQLRRLEDGTDWMDLYEKMLRAEDEDLEGEDDDDGEDAEAAPQSQRPARAPPVQAPARKGAARKAHAAPAAAPVPVPASLRAGAAQPAEAESLVRLLPRNSSQAKVAPPLGPAAGLAPAAAAAGQKRGRSNTASAPAAALARVAVRASTAPKAAAGAAAPVTPAAVARAPAAAKRPLPEAFVAADASRTVFVSNVPLDAQPAAVAALLARSGTVARLHLERNNSGKATGFGYAEFEAAAAASAAMAAAGLVLDGRVLRIGPYTASANFRNPDGSRRRDKKKAKLRDQLGAGYSERKTKRKAPARGGSAPDAGAGQ